VLLEAPSVETLTEDWSITGTSDDDCERPKVVVEKLGFSEKSRKSGDRKCLGDWGKSFVELPDAKQFLRNRSERVFQQPPKANNDVPEGPKYRSRSPPL
jgi:hypothetical protein